MSSPSLFHRLVQRFRGSGEGEDTDDAEETAGLDAEDDCPESDDGEHSFRLAVRARESPLNKQRVSCRKCPETRWR